MKSIKSRELLAAAQRKGWVIARVRGSHHQLKHPTIKGTLTIVHPTGSYPPKTLKNMMNLAGLTEDDF